MYTQNLVLVHLSFVFLMQTCAAGMYMYNLPTVHDSCTVTVYMFVMSMTANCCVVQILSDNLSVMQCTSMEPTCTCTCICTHKNMYM